MGISLMKLASSAPLNPQDDWSYVGTTVVTGMVVVFAILIILVFLLWLLGKAQNGGKAKVKAAEQKESQPELKTAAVTASEELFEDDGDEEIVAVISAAVAAFGDAEGKQYKVVGIKKKEKTLRSGWGLAGISENTRPF